MARRNIVSNPIVGKARETFHNVLPNEKIAKIYGVNGSGCVIHSLNGGWYAFAEGRLGETESGRAHKIYVPFKSEREVKDFINARANFNKKMMRAIAIAEQIVYERENRPKRKYTKKSDKWNKEEPVKEMPTPKKRGRKPNPDTVGVYRKPVAEMNDEEYKLYLEYLNEKNARYGVTKAKYGKDVMGVRHWTTWEDELVLEQSIKDDELADIIQRPSKNIQSRRSILKKTAREEEAEKAKMAMAN